MAKPRGSVPNPKLGLDVPSKSSYGELYHKQKKIILTENLERLLKNSSKEQVGGSTQADTRFKFRTEGGSVGHL